MTEHFSLSELTFSEAAIRKGLANIPSPAAIANLNRLSELLELARTVIGSPLNITSGYRSKEVNDLIGGSARSQHMSGCAADFQVSDTAPREVFRRISQARLPFDQLILEYDKWVHMSIADVGRPLRGELLVKDRSGTKEVTLDSMA